jgi:dUTP pyrophosphatase
MLTQSRSTLRHQATLEVDSIITTQSIVEVKIKKLVDHAVIPTYSKEGDAGLDLTAVSCTFNNDDLYVEYDTGISIELPPGYVGLIFPRSSISRTPHTLTNSVGIVDENYRGSIKFRFRTIEGREDTEYMVGDRIGQLVIIPYPKVKLTEVTQLNESNRGSGGFGSSGK